jgi:DNA repair protein RecN (Recombination protein N)
VLRSLLIQDFALIEHTDIQFESGLSIITGETGAGKSILMGALNMVLGERAQTHVIRNGKTKAIAEALFVLQDSLSEEIAELLKEDSIDRNGNEWLLRREIRENGSRAFINDSPVTVQTLKKVGDLLVDLHGQHDHQLLLKPEYHRLVIDQIPDVANDLTSYSKVYNEWIEAKNALKALKVKQQKLDEKVQLYEFQWKELSEAKLYLEEEEEILAELKKLDNAEDLSQNTASALAVIESDEQGLLQMTQKLTQLLGELQEIDEEFEPYIQEIKEAKISIQETANFLSTYQDKIVFDPSRLEELRQRIRQLRSLEKKYTKSIEELISYRDQIKEELAEADGFEEAIKNAENKLSLLAIELGKKAQLLHDKREKTQSALCAVVVKKLQDMGISEPKIEMKVVWNLSSSDKGIPIKNGFVICDENGADSMWFEVSMNKGEQLRPLADIASGGEISRVMLAFKDAMTAHSSLPVMVFDEIDTGISGRISEKVGRVMREISSRVQILAITHLPQIASQADYHYVVRKEEIGGRVESKIERLSEQQHIEEIASLMSGEKITDANLASANELVDKARAY